MEVEEVFRKKPKFRRGPRGNYVKENIYYALGGTEANHMLFVVFIFKRTNEALIISAREMGTKEKSMYIKL